ncbi:hypothetical protein D3C74_231370 [compost metagenome]
MDMRVLNVAAHFALGVGISNNLSDRPVAFNLYGQLLLALEHRAHHGGGGQRAPEGGCCGRVRIMPAAQLLHQLGRPHGESAHFPAHGNPADQPILLAVLVHHAKDLLSLLTKVVQKVIFPDFLNLT